MAKKRRELVEHIRVRQIQPADGIEIAQQAQRAEKTPAEQRREVAPPGRNDVRLRSMRMTIKISATKLRKNAFSNDGRSPASFTNMDMSEKPNAAMRT